MAHPGKLLELGIQTLLVKAGTMAGTRVHRDRVDPFKKGELPAIALYSPDEEVDDDSKNTAPRELKVSTDIEMQLFVSGTDAEAVSDLMWDIQEQVENALNDDRRIDGAASDSIKKSATREIIQADGRSDPLVGVVTLTYAVTYYADALPVEARPTDDFLRADAKHKFVGAVDENTPEDTFNVRTP